MNINFRIVESYYIVWFTIIMLLYCLTNPPGPIGEWDDYSLPIASILNSFSIAISQDDIYFYKLLFPDWAASIDSFSLSGFSTKTGDRLLTWYFPTYSIFCLPLVLLFKIIDIPTIYAFPCTNLFVLVISICFVRYFLKVDAKTKLLIILFLSINPIVFYISWTSAEVLIFSLLVISLASFVNKWIKTALIFVTIASTLNPVIILLGIFYIIYDFIVNKNLEVDRVLKRLILLCSILSLALIPMLYNFYNTGYINLSAGATENHFIGVFSRVFYYIFDLNFGVLPYYPFLFIVVVILFVKSSFTKSYVYLGLIITFLCIVFSYSLHPHINCGMSGVHRYVSWSVLIPFFAVVYFLDRYKAYIKLYYLLYGGFFLSAIILFNFNINLAKNYNYVYWTPQAKFVLNNFPFVYNPLPSTFNSRIRHVDGGYDYKDHLPLIYADQEGNITKVLTNFVDSKSLMSLYSFNNCNEQIKEKLMLLKNLGDEISYINFSEKCKIRKVYDYKLGENLFFSSKKNNGNKYFVRGLSNPESWGTWTDGTEVEMLFKIESNEGGVIQGLFDTHVYGGTQKISIFVNEEEVYSNDSFSGGKLQFSFNFPNNANFFKLVLKIPYARSPLSESLSSDPRILGLGFKRILFIKENAKELSVTIHSPYRA